MTLKIYGIAKSRAFRNLWMAEELGVAYEHVQIGFGPDGNKSPAFLAINPAGQIPAIDDDGLILTESLAINLHLAETRGGPLGPQDRREESLIEQWTLFAATMIEPNAQPIMYHTFLYAEADRDPAIKALHVKAIQAPLDVLEAHLAKNGGHLVGGRFTVADLNLVCCLFALRFTMEVIGERPAIRAAYKAALDRPAAVKARAMRGE